MKRRKASYYYIVHPIECCDGWVWLEHSLAGLNGPEIQVTWHGVTPPMEPVNELPYVTNRGGARWTLKPGKTDRTAKDVVDQFSVEGSEWLPQYGGEQWKTEQSNPLPLRLPVIWDGEIVATSKAATHLSTSSLESTASEKAWRSKLPKYASQADQNRMLQLRCSVCGCQRWASLDGDEPYPGIKPIRAGQGPTTATCLKCGTKDPRYYNWYGRPDESTS